MTPAAGADLLMARAWVNIETLLEQVSVPTLIIHVREGNIMPLEEAKLLVRSAAGAKLLIIKGNNHIAQPDEPAWAASKDAIMSYLCERKYERAGRRAHCSRMRGPA
ncbi:MAG: alpha/beta fold hydrolase, partial [Paracoccaceae bacterium]